jgi:hypothetical protein
MTEEEIKQEAREHIGRAIAKEFYLNFPDLQEQYEKVTKVCLNVANLILSIPNLVIIDPEAKLPVNPHPEYLTISDEHGTEQLECIEYQAHKEGQQSLISQGWVKKL